MATSARPGDAVEATGRDRANGAPEGRPVEGVGARLELRRALPHGRAGRRVVISAGLRVAARLPTRPPPSPSLFQP